MAHLGAFEIHAFLALTEEFSNLHVDTSMTLTPYSRRYVGFDAGVRFLRLG